MDLLYDESLSKEQVQHLMVQLAGMINFRDKDLAESESNPLVEARIYVKENVLIINNFKTYEKEIKRL